MNRKLLDKQTTDIAVGDTVRLEFEWEPEEATEYTVLVLLDPLEKVEETDEENNDHTGTLSVGEEVYGFTTLSYILFAVLIGLACAMVALLVYIIRYKR